jgi:hypothetical protein
MFKNIGEDFHAYDRQMGSPGILGDDSVSVWPLAL